MKHPFPFAAIAGQEQLKLALLLNAIDTTIGGVLICGDKGTAKSTAARGLAQLLPPIEKYPGCAFNCLPGQPADACENCRDMELPPVTVPAPFVNLPLGAMEDRVIGTLDFERALKTGKRSFQPGLLATAHRGILFVDEVNLLGDNLVDVLLDVAAMGMNFIQREGLSIEHPAQFSLVGTMNFEEGELRSQFLDRFGLVVNVSASRDPELRCEIVRRRLAFESAAEQFLFSWATEQDKIKQQIGQARKRLQEVTVTSDQHRLISQLCCRLDVISLRADIVMHKCVRALAAWFGRMHVDAGDIKQAAQLVLPHRRRKKSRQISQLDDDLLEGQLQEILEQMAGDNIESSPQVNIDSSLSQEDGVDHRRDNEHSADNRSKGDYSKGNNDCYPRSMAESASANKNRNGTENGDGTARGDRIPDDRVFSAVESHPVQFDISTCETASATVQAGKRRTIVDSITGYYLRNKDGFNPDNLSIAGTIQRSITRTGGQLQVEKTDWQEKVRQTKSGMLIVFVIDSSGSMAAVNRMEMVKGCVSSLLRDAYQNRDEIAVISFRGENAEVLINPGKNTQQALRQLEQLPTGGRSPLSHALCIARAILTQYRGKQLLPLLVVITDGKANVSMQPGIDPWQETLHIADELSSARMPALFIDTENDFIRLGKTRQLAQHMNADYVLMEEITADKLAVRIKSVAGRK